MARNLVVCSMLLSFFVIISTISPSFADEIKATDQIKKNPAMMEMLKKIELSKKAKELRRGYYKNWQGNNYEVLGVGIHTETLEEMVIYQAIAALVSWGAIGARTTESQVHRELASGLSMAVGFKNATDGNVQGAVDAMRAAANPHHFLSVTKQGVAAIVATRGNEDTHVILRGGARGPNYDEKSVAGVCKQLDKAGLPLRVMIDCSHGNSSKQHLRQGEVAEDVAGQVARGSRALFGVMLESFLEDGRQDWAPGMPFGKSITDACMSWERTLPLFDDLAEAVRKRRGR